MTPPRARSVRGAASALWLLATLTVTAPSAAATPAGLLREGVTLRARGEDAAALAKFTEANRIAPSAEAKAQIALAEQALGRWVEAELHLRTALEDTKSPFIVKYGDALREALGVIAKHTTVITLASVPADARVSVDGGPFDAPVSAYKLVGGLHRFRVRRDGYAETPKDVECAGGAECREEVKLLPAVSPLAGAGGASPSAAPALRASRGSWMTPVGLGASAAGLAGVAFGAIMHANRESIASDRSRVVEPCFEGSSCASAVRSAQSTETLAVVGYVAGGALLVSGVTLLVLAPRSVRAQAKDRVRCAPGLAAVVCGGTF